MINIYRIKVFPENLHLGEYTLCIIQGHVVAQGPWDDFVDEKVAGIVLGLSLANLETNQKLIEITDDFLYGKCSRGEAEKHLEKLAEAAGLNQQS